MNGIIVLKEYILLYNKILCTDMLIIILLSSLLNVCLVCVRTVDTLFQCSYGRHTAVFVW